MSIKPSEIRKMERAFVLVRDCSGEPLRLIEYRNGHDSEGYLYTRFFGICECCGEDAEREVMVKPHEAAHHVWSFVETYLFQGTKEELTPLVTRKAREAFLKDRAELIRGLQRRMGRMRLT